MAHRRYAGAFALFVGVFISIGAAGCDCGDDGVKIVSPETALALIEENRGDESFVILDVRTPEEFAADHIEGAINIDFFGDAFWDHIAALDKTTTYLVYCKSGGRSGQATQGMVERGFESVYDIQGGITSLREWEASASG